MKKIKLVHVDDQENQLKMLKTVLKSFDEVELVGQFNNAIKAKEYILDNDIDLVVLDVEMPGNDGLWLADQIKGSKALIVFLTAHPDYTLQAFEACAINYILKPLTKSVLSKVIAQYKKLKDNKSMDALIQNDQINELIENYLKKTSYPKRIFINNVHKTTILNLNEVMYMISNGPYTIIKTTDGAKHTASKSLKVYYDILHEHPDFTRIHRAHLVNKTFVKAVLRNKHKIFAEMTDSEKLEITPLKREEIYTMLRQ